MVIFVNGSVNSGKSTIAKLLADKIGNTANLEIDKLRGFINWMTIDEAIPLNLKNAVSLIKNFVESGINVVIPYPLSQKNYDYLMANLNGLNTKILVFTLAPKLQKVVTNRGNRELDEWEISRIKHHYEIGIQNPKFGEIIDNTDQLPEETLEVVLKKINSEIVV